MCMKNKYIVLDRDGTLIKHFPYLKDIELVQILPYVVDGLKLLRNLGYSFGIISNQSVIGRGQASETTVSSINKKISEMLGNYGLEIKFIYFCPHSPDDNCLCRKPLPKLGIEAIHAFGIDTESSFYIGDSELDMEFGKNIGLKTIKLPGVLSYNGQMDTYANHLLDAALIIQNRFHK